MSTATDSTAARELAPYKSLENAELSDRIEAVRPGRGGEEEGRGAGEAQGPQHGARTDGEPGGVSHGKRVLSSLGRSGDAGFRMS